ncbi:hypothetical protein [Phaeobacter sp. NW0010-22]|uniref:hypothetical protein n=1 Tax=Phaeobacter sp. NW0010-22 TaxID=3135907 RepID=UPI003107B336
MQRRLVLGFGILLAGAALAETHTDYGASDDWIIRINPANGNGCYMQKTFENGTVVQVGAVPDREGAFFAAYNTAWIDIVEGEAGSLLLDFEDSRFQGEVLGGSFEGAPGGYAFFNNPEFVSEFGRRRSVTITGERGGSEKIDLTGSSRAIGTVTACQDEQD